MMEPQPIAVTVWLHPPYFLVTYILLIFLIATIMSPPDLLSQLVIAFPLWLFLEAAWFILALMKAKEDSIQKN